MRPVHWIMELSIDEQKVDDIDTLMEELVSEADREIGTMAHEWNFSDDGSVCQLYERFVDADAAMLHLSMFGEQFADRFLSACSVTGVTILGYANEDVLGALARFSPNVLTQKAGFARFAD